MSNLSVSAAGTGDLSHDLGTFWTLTRDDSVARCVLLASADEWELRVLVNSEPLLSKRCKGPEDLFGIAEAWKIRLVERGWSQAASAPVPLPVRRHRRPPADGRP